MISSAPVLHRVVSVGRRGRRTGRYVRCWPNPVIRERRLRGSSNRCRYKPMESSRPTTVVRFGYRDLLSRSAIRVCHPGPVAFQRSITFAGSRREINFRGFAETGRPPFFNFARSSISVVRRGNSSYSLEW